MKEFFDILFGEWWGILIVCVVCLAVWLLLSAALYKPFFKRFYDIVLSLIAILIFSPILLTLTVLGAIKMGGNPFFTQKRPGKNEKIFKLIKFRTMTNKRDEEGNLLPDADRLTKYGKFLRSTSLDELPELFNILLGTMSIVGPRPLLVEYLPYYKEHERIRHSVRSGLTGLAQISGRNTITWSEKFAKDIEYVENISFINDLKIIFKTAFKVVKSTDIRVDALENLDCVRELQKDIIIQKEEIYIRKTVKRDILRMQRWSKEDKKFIYNFCEMNKEDKTRLDCIFYYDEVAVGVIGLLKIDKESRTAEYYVTLGETQYRKKGISFIASKLLLDYAFDKLELEKIVLYVDESNVVAQGLYEKLGFRNDMELNEFLISNDKQIARKFYQISKQSFLDKFYKIEEESLIKE